MKHRIYTVLLFAVMLVLLGTACSLQKAEKALDAAEDAVEQRLDVLEDTLEGEIRITPAPVPKAGTPEVQPPGELNGSMADAEYLSREQAQTIALEHAGFAAAEVAYLRAEFDVDDGVPEYDVQFNHGRWEYEYEIHARSGTILFFEKDD